MKSEFLIHNYVLKNMSLILRTRYDVDRRFIKNYEIKYVKFYGKVSTEAYINFSNACFSAIIIHNHKEKFQTGSIYIYNISFDFEKRQILVFCPKFYNHLFGTCVEEDKEVYTNLYLIICLNKTGWMKFFKTMRPDYMYYTYIKKKKFTNDLQFF